MTIVAAAVSGTPNFGVGEGDGPVEVCVQAVAIAGVLKRTVSVMLSTRNGTAAGKITYIGQAN